MTTLKDATGGVWTLDVRSKIKTGEYASKLPDFVSVPVNEETMTIKAAREHKESERARRNEHRMAVYAESGILRNAFQADLEKENGLAGHPKATKVFDLAWREGHFEGWARIVDWYEELAELVT